MRILNFPGFHKGLRIAMQMLRNQGIAVSGPYQRQNGTFVVGLSDQVVKEDELLRLRREGRLNEKGIRDLLSRV